MKSSAMRDLMAITERPEVISLAGGLPDTSTFPAESLAALLSKRRRHRRRPARCSTRRPRAWPPSARRIAKVMAAEGTDVDPEDVLVTTGGQQVIDLVCKTLIDPGDVIVAEAPTYPGAVPAFSAYQADVVQIAMDDDGMRVDELEATLDRLEREGRRPKFIYTIPTFQNPAGVTMSLPRRRRLVRSPRERELLVLEDNPYGLLRYEGEPLPTLRSLDGGDFVIYLGTFSKILSPGIRLGWTVAPAPVLEKMNLGKQAQRPVLVVAVAALRRRRTSPRATGRTTSPPLRDLYRAPARHDARRAGRAPAARGRVDAARRAGCSSGPRCPTTSTRPTCSPARCRATSPSSRAARPTSTAAAARRCG